MDYLLESTFRNPNREVKLRDCYTLIVPPDTTEAFNLEEPLFKRFNNFLLLVQMAPITSTNAALDFSNGY